jgi:hypothetical protein
MRCNAFSCDWLSVRNAQIGMFGLDSRSCRRRSGQSIRLECETQQGCAEQLGECLV